MDYDVFPGALSGTVKIPASKSVAHRAILCAALADGTSVIHNATPSEDIDATCLAAQQLGATVVRDGDTITVTGRTESEAAVTLNCRESGSTLRFLLPIAAALGLEATFIGQGRLPYRPLGPYLDAAASHGVSFEMPDDASLPLKSIGTLTAGEYALAGNISSQFVTGLLLALPLLDGNSTIRFTTPLESVPYVTMTLAVMAKFGVHAEQTKDGFSISARQHYHATEYTVEGDYSQAAFFLTAKAIGHDITLNGISEKSLQGDEKIVEIIAGLCYNNRNEIINGFSVDARDIPDLVPILAVLGTFCGKPCTITGAQRLRLKESDRLSAISAALNAIGGKVEQTEDGLLITPVSALHGGEIDCAGDHRIAMSLAIAATRADGPVRLRGGDAVRKSYPAFYQDLESLGGNIHVIPLE
ncbi:MAG: 3-phosphoshikimate 1-carboxyvinyltransferase [Ruminococcus sp.]|nr:3-phosphoshikimate 1-carboxyvinyltransferase [Ruminococcus sp.]